MFNDYRNSRTEKNVNMFLFKISSLSQQKLINEKLLQNKSNIDYTFPKLRLDEYIRRVTPHQ